MICIQEYLEQVFEDLQEENDRGVLYRKLNNLSLASGCLPDYQDSQIQRLYLLKYAFAYACEYTDMYLDVLNTMGHPAALSVVSIGCGSMLDYWSLVQALEQKNLGFCRVTYTGVDRIGWQNRVAAREKDQVLFREESGIDFFRQDPCFTQDIYCFPQSIGEFAEEEIRAIAAKFAEAEFSKDVIYLCVSIRANAKSWDRDIRRTKMLMEAIEDNGFTAKESYDCYTYYKENRGIVLYNRDYVYPDGAMDYVLQCNERWEQWIREGGYGETERVTSTFKTDMISYQIMRLERKSSPYVSIFLSPFPQNITTKGRL